MMQQKVNISIETPKWSFVKRNELGKVDLYSPLPSPFHYGRVQSLQHGNTQPTDVQGGDGDPLDALLLDSSTYQYGDVVEAFVVGVVRFIDKDQRDDKWILSSVPEVSWYDKAKIALFFHNYALIKKIATRRKDSKVEDIVYFSK